MKQSICAFLGACALVLTIHGSAGAEDRWELGVSGGYAISRDVKVESQAGQASAGLRPGVLFGIVAGNQVRPWLSGEARYTYRQGDVKLSGSGAEARFDSESHALHYDFVFQGRARGERRVQPFVAAGAGIRYFRGTGREARNQALSRIAILTKTSEIRPLISIGGGVKIPISRLMSVRVEARDYVTPFPSELIAPVPGARTSGWLHDFTPMVGLSFTF